MLDTLISYDPYSQMDFEAVHEEHLDYYLTHDEDIKNKIFKTVFTCIIQ